MMIEVDDMNNKGFTLVEILAMLVVLGILMVITIPNVTGILANNKFKVMKADADKTVDTAKIRFSQLKPVNKPKVNECVVYSLNALNNTGDITKGPNGGQYLQYESFVAVTRKANRYEYYIRLVELYDDTKKIGIELKESSGLSEGKIDYIKEITSEVMDEESTGKAEEGKAKLTEYLSDAGVCTSIISYDVGKAYAEE